MPLRDHFRPPLSIERHWHALHNARSTFIASELNRCLPEGYFAEPNVQFGIEIDVAAFEEAASGKSGVGVPWSVPAPTLTVPVSIISDIVEVLVYAREGGPTLAGAIELVSPANKDRPEHRDAFVSKCAAYVQQGIGLIVIDVVTGRKANLHRELLTRVSPSSGETLDADLYTVAYRMVERGEQPSLDVWEHRLAIGQPLPTLPLCLRGNLSIPLDLETSYERTCSEQRIRSNGA